MITIFNGRRRGIAGGESVAWAQIDTSMRENLHLFKLNNDLNAWAIFTCIALHCDENGWSWPSTDTIKRFTGLTSDEAITRSIKHLRTLEIDGQPILHHYREKLKGQWGRSFYHIFPLAGGETAQPVDNLIRWKPSPLEPGMAQPGMADGGDSKKSHIKPEPSSKKKKESNTYAANAADKKERTPLATDILFDAIANHVLGVSTPEGLEAVGWRVGQIMFGDKDRRTLGLIDFECKRQKIYGHELDFAALAADVPVFMRNFRKFHPGIDLKDCAKFMEWWSVFREKQQQKTSTTPDLVEDPEMPGVMIYKNDLELRGRQRAELKEA